MEIFQAIILGIVEGLTEFLPISSTGHLIVAEDALGFYDASKMFTVVVQAGAILAVMWYYRAQLGKLILDLFRGDKAAKRFWLIWILATIPAGVMGFLFDDKLETYAVTATVGIALILGGIAIWLIETYHKAAKSDGEAKLDKLTFRQSILIGLYQVLALVPGVSRSGATIMGGLLSGVDRVTATAFSFYLGIPILLLASVYKLATGDAGDVPGGAMALLAGLIASFITALFVIGWLLRYVSKHDFKIFAYYRIIFGIFLLILVAFGILG